MDFPTLRRLNCYYRGKYNHKEAGVTNLTCVWADGGRCAVGSGGAWVCQMSHFDSKWAVLAVRGELLRGTVRSTQLYVLVRPRHHFAKSQAPQCETF